MSKSNFILTVLVLVLVLFSSALALPPVLLGERRSYWSDLDPANHNWNEPNNWWTVDFYFVDANENGSWNHQPILEEKWYVKVDQNEVPDINIAAFIGKGELRADYPEELAALINVGFVMTDPTIYSGTFDVNRVDLGGGSSAVSTPDPNTDHYMTITGGTLNIGTPIYGDWYRVWGFAGTFVGQWAGSALRIGIVSAGGTGTMNMTDGTVNVGGHIELGGWSGTGELYMDGGTINVIQGLYCPGSLYGSIGRVYLRGGTINAGYLDMYTAPPWSPEIASATGEIDFAGGIMKLDGHDEVEIVERYASGDAPGATITAYGVPSGESVVDVESPEYDKRAFLNIAYTADDKTTVHAVATELAQAWAPVPADGSADVRGPADDLARPILEWSPGDGAFTHDVYFGADFDEVNDADISDTNVFMVTLSEEDVNYAPDVDLVSLATYYWRIDEVKNNGAVTKGSVWRFTCADFEKASHPVPQDGAVNVFPTELTWTPGIYAVTHDVYFSTDFNDVNDRLILPDNVGTNVYPLTGLTFETTYYWRVDEVNGLGVPYPGDLWRFTITDHINIDDMDQYNTTNNLINDTWKDYWYNYTEAELNVNSSIIYGGTRGMEFSYENDCAGGPYYSEAEADIADLEVSPDWTTGGADSIVIYFYGQSSNVADANNQMYFAVEDGDDNFALITYPDVTALQQAEWHEWNIALQELTDQGVDVTDIATVYLGFGDRTLPVPSGGLIVDESVVYIDEIELWPQRCAPQASRPYGDLNGDCTIDNWDLTEMVADWLVVDYNTIGFDGELWHFPLDGEPNYDECWVDGRTGESGDYGLEFGYEHERDLNEWPISDDFVAVPPLNLYSNIMTITAWVKIHGLQRDDAAIFYCDGVFNDPIWLGDTTAGFNLGIGNDNSLGYMWPTAKGDTWQWDPAIPVLPDREWAFCAMVVMPDEAVIYIKLPEGDLLYDRNIGSVHLDAKFEIPSTIGFHKWRNFDGVMDDLRIFKKSLSYFEILWLATDGEGIDSVDPGSPYVWYKFDEGTGLVTGDSGEGGLMYHPNPSRANLYEDEPIYQRYVNFKDYSVMADNWLRDLTFPIE